MESAAYIGAYWGARGETVEDVAGRLAECCGGLAAVSPLLAAWRSKGSSPSDGELVPLDADSLAAFVKLGEVAAAGSDASLGADLGYTLGLWTGEANRSAGLTIRAGSGATTPGMTSNSVVLKLPRPNGTDDQLYRRESALQMMRVVVSAWDPDWAAWCNTQLRRAQAARSGDVTAGWATYLGAGYRFPSTVGQAAISGLSTGALVTLPGSPTTVSEQSVLTVHDAIERTMTA